uniref:Uncharacterized protein n=1 Tax=Hyaloperonospora arabidopsidis (strain Emoy2) TaxID=559515 RepID=M4C3L5_HYAAE
MFSSARPDTLRPAVRLGKFELVVDLKIRPGEQSKATVRKRPGSMSSWLTGNTAVVIELLLKRPLSPESKLLQERQHTKHPV